MNPHDAVSGLASPQVLQPLFPLGQIVATPAVVAHFDEHRQSLLPLLRRHVLGDWGELCAEDRAENDRAVRQGFRLPSRYHVSGETVWIISHRRTAAVSNP